MPTLYVYQTGLNPAEVYFIQILFECKCTKLSWTELTNFYD